MISLNYFNEMLKTKMDEHYSISPFYYNRLNTKQTGLGIADTVLDLTVKNDIFASGLINSLKASNTGKILYIDFWATWCSPCRAEMTFSKSLHDKYKNENIEFIYICIDSEAEQFTSFLSKNNVPGTHYYLNKTQSALIQKKLKIKTIPHYMIIDPNGVILYEGNSLRPSSDETAKKLNEIIKSGV